MAAEESNSSVRGTHLSLKLAVDFEAKVITGIATYTVEVVKNGATQFVLDTSELVITKVEVDGVRAKFRQHHTFGRTLEITLPGAERAAGSAATVSIFYNTSPRSSAVQWLPPAQTAGKARPYLVTQCQAIHAHALLPCQDTPAAKLTYNATVEVPEWATCLLSARSTGAPTTAGSSEGMHTFSFHQPVPVPSYLITLAVGDLALREISHQGREDVALFESRYSAALQALCPLLEGNDPDDAFSSVSGPWLCRGKSSLATLLEAETSKSHLVRSQDDIVLRGILHEIRLRSVKREPRRTKSFGDLSGKSNKKRNARRLCAGLGSGSGAAPEGTAAAAGSTALGQAPCSAAQGSKASLLVTGHQQSKGSELLLDSPNFNHARGGFSTPMPSTASMSPLSEHQHPPPSVLASVPTQSASSTQRNEELDMHPMLQPDSPTLSGALAGPSMLASASSSSDHGHLHLAAPAVLEVELPTQGHEELAMLQLASPSFSGTLGGPSTPSTSTMSTTSTSPRSDCGHLHLVPPALSELESPAQHGSNSGGDVPWDGLPRPFPAGFSAPSPGQPALSEEVHGSVRVCGLLPGHGGSCLQLIDVESGQRLDFIAYARC
eukprot:TRINITY_DN9190_c0_g1_i6.p1 TRINITY_DN9190_c0_g1~~TRINITY_DN9190_c0_g1_i6.p1  ORF type:complete len:607 (+),score=69.87 TRINITY_DN9190_c0_g1_i6:117-1937(+)